MKTIDVPCLADEIIWYPVEALPLPIRPLVTEVRITRYGVMVDAVNPRTGEKFTFPGSAFGKTVFAGDEGKMKAFEICKKRNEERKQNEKG